MNNQEVNTDGSVKLSVRNVGKRYPTGGGTCIEALKDVSFDLIENEICVIVGPSGCGKSTLLQMVAGLQQCSSGAIMMDDRRIEAPGRERGMVFQGYTSFPWLTVQQNVEYGMRLNGVSKAARAERAEHFIDLVRLGQFRDAYPKQLSGGMKQRVAIARTLANDPGILLMDEPFGALDAETRWHMQELMLNVIENSRTTVLLVTHDIPEAIFLADRIIFLSRHPGRIREILNLEFKNGERIRNKEDLITRPGYAEMETRILQMLRDETPEMDEDAPQASAAG